MIAAMVPLVMLLGAPGAPGAPCAAGQALPSPIVCGDAGLRWLDGELQRLVAQVRGETAGVDGETGRAIDPIAVEQRRWQQATLARCRDVACLTAAYRSRIHAIRNRWAEALR